MNRPPAFPWPYGPAAAGPGGGGFSHPSHFLQNVNLQFPANIQYSQQPLNFPHAVFQNPRFVQPQNTFIGNAGFPAARPFSIPSVTLEMVECEAVKLHQDLVAAGVNVSAWKVSQDVLVALKVDSWSSLGFHLQEVPTLQRILLTEGKVNALIHCFVCARKIASMYELGISLCQNMGIRQFEELGLGPFLHHPLIKHYFAVPSDLTEIFKITSEEIIVSLQEFINKSKKTISVENFLMFLAEQKSVPKEILGVRIQTIGFYVNHIREASKAECTLLREKVNRSIAGFYDNEVIGKMGGSKSCSTAVEKQILDNRFHNISSRVKTFCSKLNNSSNKHVYFVSSDDNNDSKIDDDFDVEDDGEGKTDISDHQNISPVKGSGQFVSSCPYPSNSEEMVRLGLKPVDSNKPSPASGCISTKENMKSFRRKRKLKNNNSASSSCKFLKSVEVVDLEAQDQMCDRTLSSGDIEKFVATWKVACQKHSPSEVLDMMLSFYVGKPRKRKKIKKLVSSYPIIGCFNVAVTSIKRGMFESMYDTFLALNEKELMGTDSVCFGEMMDGRPTVEVSDPTISIDCGYSVTHDDIIKKIASYFENYQMTPKQGGLSPEKLTAIKKLYDCEMWLMAQFNVPQFCSLGHGNFYDFLEKYSSILPPEMHVFFSKEYVHESSVEACLNQQQLGVMLSQAEGNLIAKADTSNFDTVSLLKKQFPTATFRMVGFDQKKFEKLINKENGNSSCVLFSACLLGDQWNRKLLVCKENSSLDMKGMETEVAHQYTCRTTSKDAIECLLKAPMLADLLYWSHWDLLYAPSLGPLPEFLLNKANYKNLLCIATVDGKFVRIDHAATVDEFLEAFVQCSSFRIALKFLSLLCLYRGTNNAPLALLKCYAQKAVDVIIRNSTDSIEVNVGGRNFIPGKIVVNTCSCCNFIPTNGIKDFNGSCDNSTLYAGLCRVNGAIATISRTILECLQYMPSEFRSSAAEILLSGVRSITKQAPIVILNQCNRTEERIMLHDIGISLGVAEWVTDHHQFSSSTVLDLSVPFKAVDQFSSSFCLQSALDHRNSGQASEVSASENQKATLGKIGDALVVDANRGSSSAGNCATTSIFNEFGDIDGSQALCEATAVSTKISEDQVHDATAIVELIRQEEFGLSSNSNKCVDNLLKKQHARLGRALHCLSQELYSQDSHFILELVQNADDNIYPGNVEPELVFILHEKGIVVLNNELGFSAENIRALCDVGNSTKKGSGGGYIGKKGIGFKSVFRVTDAPEIHSNGFHVKFDITEGQIGFVLPTVIPPCDAGTFKQYLCGESYQSNDMAWNTCILLPFRSQSRGGAGVSSIISMFSDLHPSLLLFLHHLRCIKFRNLLSDRVIVMRKNTLHDGIVKVSHGEEVMSWLVTSKKLRPSVIRTDVETTDISLAFTLQESEYGEYKPILRNQPVFSFLPLRNYGFKFILQGDFVLPSSREEVDGDSAWNQWLLSEFPSLFFSAEQCFCALPCFLDNPGKAVTIYMSFVPLAGEVHGFFSQLPQMIISLLRISNCLLQDSPDLTWVLPCRVLRSWNEEARLLLSNHLLQRHLGLVYLHKDVKLSNTLAMALGIRDYGPKILVEVMESVCHSREDLKSLGIDWLSAWLAAVYSSLSMNLTQHSSLNADVEHDIINDLKNILLIPLSDGSYGYVADGPIWLPCDVLNIGSKGEYHPADFPCLYKKLQIVNPQLFSVATKNAYSMRDLKADNVMQMLLKIGVQQLSAHEVIRSHILVALSNKYTSEDRDLMIEYLSFIMLHLQSDCASCYSERREIITELGKLPLLLTNHGYKCPSKEPIHFGREYGNHVDAVVLFDAVDIKWIEVDPSYLKHPSTLSLSSGLMKWRAFFLDLGVTDFVQVTFTDKSVEDFLSDGTLSITSFSSATSYVKDCESPEFVNLLSILSSKKLRSKCIYLLEVLDKMWDDSYSVYAKSFIISKIDGAKKPIVSSFMKSIHEFSWIASTMDKDLHQPYNMFYDCEQVHSVFGMMGPYAVPKVNSMVLVNDIGFKMEVSINDAVEILQFWRMSMSPFVSSIAQMLKFYTLISSGIATASSKIVEELISSCFIFVPFISCCRSSAPSSGMFLSPKEVYWQDPTGCVDKMKELMLLCTSIKDKHFLCKSLETVYPTLRDFFVNVCGVPGTPPFSSYFQILQQLSAIALPSQAAHKVFQVMVRWGDDLKSGLVSPDQILELKNNFMKLENAVLPTVLDKWVSLHPSFGLICWSDDDELKKQFKHSDGVDFIQFGELSVEEKAMLSGGVATIFQIIGVPPLSEIVSREAICYGTEENRDKVILLNWVIPYAQRYIHKLHPETYLKLKQLGFEKLTQLQVVVVSNLFYKYTLQGRDCASKRRFECNCVLQGNILYACPTTDTHSMFLELSRYFFNGSSELHFANFLHMVTTMAQSDSTDEQIDFFVINSQKIPKLPDDESLWSISSVGTVDEHKTSQSIPVPSMDPECGSSKSSHRKPGISSCWPPTDWKTAPDFEYSRSRNLRTRPFNSPQVGFSKAAEDVAQMEAPVSVEITGNWTLEEGSIPVSTSLLQDSASLHCQSYLQSDSAKSLEYPASEPTAPFEEHGDISAQISLLTVPLEKPKINKQTSAEHLLRRTTGRLGEMLAYKYYTEKLGCTDVRWVNEENESGLPYDLVVGENETRQYIEVKATQSATKDWFEITSREWQFALEKQDSYSIAHVAILGTDKANVTVLKNPYKLCRQNFIGLAILMPKR